MKNSAIRDNHKKFGLALLINILLPGLGNLLITRSPANFLALFFSILALNSHDWRVILGWYLLMGVKSYIDVYVNPPAKEIRKSSEHSPEFELETIGQGNREFHELRESDERTFHASHDEVESYFEQNLPEAQVAQRQRSPINPSTHSHGGAVGLESGSRDSSYEIKHHYANLHNEASGAGTFSHGAPQPLQNLQPQPQAEKVHFAPVEEKHYSHGAPLPLNQAAKQSESEAESENSIRIPQPEHSLPHKAPVPLNAITALSRDGEEEIVESHHNTHVLLNQQKSIEEVLGDSNIPDKGQTPQTDSEEELAPIMDLYEDSIVTESSPSPFGTSPGPDKVELCPTCQRPRSHNRPSCPACGTPFEQGSV